MKRERVLEISDALVEVSQSHTITVGVRDGFVPRENYYVNVTPVLSFSALDITKLQRLADSLALEVGFINGSFVFTETK